MAYFDIPTYGGGTASTLPDAPLPLGGVRQYAADDKSPAALQVRNWWQQFRAPANPAASARGTGGGGSAAATDPNKPKMSTLSSVKNPAFTGPQNSLLADFNLGREAGNTSFANMLAEFNSTAAQRRGDRDQDRSARDLTGFFANRDAIRDAQEAKLRLQGDEMIRSARAGGEREDAMSGLPGTMSSARENRAMSAWLSAKLPIEQQILSQRAEDARNDQMLKLSTAGLNAATDQNYLNTLLGPERARQSMLGGYINTLGGVQRLDQDNTFYQSFVERDANLNYPTYGGSGGSGVSGYVPGVRAVAPMRFPSPTGSGRNGGGGGTGGGTGGVRPRSQAEQIYQQQFGFYPNEDVNFSSDPSLRDAYEGIRQSLLWNPNEGGRMDSAGERARLANDSRDWNSYYANQTDRGQFDEEDTYFSSLP